MPPSSASPVNAARPSAVGRRDGRTRAASRRPSRSPPTPGTPLCLDSFPAASSSWMTGCCASTAPLTALAEGWVRTDQTGRRARGRVGGELRHADSAHDRAQRVVHRRAAQGPRGGGLPVGIRRRRARRDAAAAVPDHPRHGHVGHRVAARVPHLDAPAAAGSSVLTGPVWLSPERIVTPEAAPAVAVWTNATGDPASPSTLASVRWLPGRSAQRARDRRAPIVAGGGRWRAHARRRPRSSRRR